MSGGQSARWTDEEMPDEFLGRALSFIDGNKDEPFFLFYAMHENHVPRIPHPRFRGSSGLGVRGDAVVQMDWGIGRIMEMLRDLGIEKNTLVIFSSDNGPVLYDGYYDGAIEMNGDHKPSGPWRGGKYSAWEGGTRLPLIVYWPGTVKPGLSDALISQVDFVASLASLTGADIPGGDCQDSQDQADVLLGVSDVGRESLIQQGVNMEAIRMGDWKYVPPGQVTNRRGVDSFERDRIAAPGALFYLPEDPMELNNLAHRYPAKVRGLRAMLEKEIGPLDGKAGKGGLGGAVEN